MRVPKEQACAILDSGSAFVDIQSATATATINGVSTPDPGEVVTTLPGTPITDISFVDACDLTGINLEFNPTTVRVTPAGAATVDFLLTTDGIDLELVNLRGDTPGQPSSDLHITMDCRVGGGVHADVDGDGIYEERATPEHQIQIPASCDTDSAEHCDDGNECTMDMCTSGVCTHGPNEDGVACGDGAGICRSGRCTMTFPCTEEGIRDAIAMGGGPHTFDCQGQQTVLTGAELVINSDVILDGEGNLTVDGNESHRVFSVAEGRTAELRGISVTNGRADIGEPGGGVLNLGVLKLNDSVVVGNSAEWCVFRPNRCSEGGGIQNYGALTLTNSTVSDNHAIESGGGIWNGGTAELNDSTVSQNSVRDDHGGGIENQGNLKMTNCTVTANFIETGSGASGGGGVSKRWNSGGDRQHHLVELHAAMGRWHRE